MELEQQQQRAAAEARQVLRHMQCLQDEVQVLLLTSLSFFCIT